MDDILTQRHYHEAKRVISEEMAALERVLGGIETNFDACVERLLGIPGKIVVTGVGKSGLIGHKIAATLASTGNPSVFINASEALHGDLGVVQAEDAVLLLSASAATLELVRMQPAIQSLGALTIGLFGRVDTPLAEACDIVLDVSVGCEACPLNLSPMSSTTAMLVVGDAIAAALMLAKGFGSDDFARYHPGGSLGRRLLQKVVDVMHTGDALPVVTESTTFRQLLVEIARPNFGIVCVVDADKRLLGVVTDGDIRRMLLKYATMDITAGQMMTREPKYGLPHQRLDDLLQLMEKHRIYALPIVDADRVVQGVVRMHDILEAS